MAKMVKCKGCGAPIVWIKTPGGKSIPCDPDMVPYWQKAGAKGKVVTPNGETISCEFDGDLQTATGLGYVSHWGTCPMADSFRRRK